MVKAYLRYEASGAWGVITSLNSNIIYDASGKLLITGALESVLVWNIKQGAVVKTLTATNEKGLAPEVTMIARSLQSFNQISVGYSDGSIRAWDIVKGTCEFSLNGHKKAITALRYNRQSSMMASGGKDTDVIVWDVAGEIGLFRLRGHRDQVTDMAFLERRNCLVSCSKDTFARVWDLDTQHCVQIIVGHRGEIWSLDVDPGQTRLVTGSSDMELRVYEVLDDKAEGHLSSRSQSHSKVAGGEGKEENVQEVEELKGKFDVLRFMGCVKKQGTDRVSTLRYSNDGSYLGCQLAGHTLELYRVREESEAWRKAKRRKKRKKEKLVNKEVAEGEQEEEEEEERGIAKADDAEPSVTAADEIGFVQALRSKHKIRSFAFNPAQPRSRKGAVATSLALALQNNSLEVYDVTATACESMHLIDLPGHRSDVRALALSSDDSLLLSTSHNAAKVWNPRTGVCLRAMEAGYGLCAAFVPGNRQAVVGTKTGGLEIFDVGASVRVDVVNAHEGAVWSIANTPGTPGLVSGGADHDVKFWEYEWVEEDSQGEGSNKRLGLRNTRTLRMADDVLCLRFSPDGKYIAVALLDSTVKVFFADSLKFFLSLYGHKLPVLCMDVSSDAQLLVTGSADKNVKIWGLDFGDCHRSLFAHDDSVSQVAFVRGTHYFFSAGKDRLLKYWDADKFELLLSLEGHHSEVWAMAVSSHGDFVVTGAHDRSMRRWERTEEPFFVEEEREKRLESLFEAGIEESGGRAVRDEGDADAEVGEEGAVAAAGHRSQESVSATDSIIDALDIAEAETDSRRLWQAEKERRSSSSAKAPPPNPLLLGLSPSAYVLRAVANVRPSDLEQALLVLPFTDALKLLSYVEEWTQDLTKVELTCRVATLLLRIHHQQLVATATARETLTRLSAVLRPCAQLLRDTLGFNMAAMSHVKRVLATQSKVVTNEALDKVTEVRKKLAKGREGIIAENKKEKRKKKKRKLMEVAGG